MLTGGVPHPAPALQKPPPELTPAGIEKALTVFDASLAWLRRRFPQSAIMVVYLPSPAAIYRQADTMVDAMWTGRSTTCVPWLP